MIVFFQTRSRYGFPFIVGVIDVYDGQGSFNVYSLLVVCFFNQSLNDHRYQTNITMVVHGYT